MRCIERDLYRAAFAWSSDLYRIWTVLFVLMDMSDDLFFHNFHLCFNGSTAVLGTVSAPFKMREGRFPSLWFLVRFISRFFGFFAAGLETWFLFKRKSGLLGFLYDFIHEVLKNLCVELRGIDRTVPFHIAFLKFQAV